MGSKGSAARELLVRLSRLVEPVLVAVTVGGLTVGGIAWLAGSHRVANGCRMAESVVASSSRWCGCWPPSVVNGQFNSPWTATCFLLSTMAAGRNPHSSAHHDAQAVISGGN